jgi:hypothetical protein
MWAARAVVLVALFSCCRSFQENVPLRSLDDAAEVPHLHQLHDGEALSVPKRAVLAQEYADTIARGKWVPREHKEGSLGAKDRYDNCSMYSGLHIENEAYEKCELGSWSAPAETEYKTDYDPVAAREVTRGQWIAFVGDSNVRLLFADFVHIINGTMSSYTTGKCDGQVPTGECMPSHDFNFQSHWKEVDRCFEGDSCHRELIHEASNTRVTFDFTTTLWEIKVIVW